MLCMPKHTKVVRPLVRTKFQVCIVFRLVRRSRTTHKLKNRHMSHVKVGIFSTGYSPHMDFDKKLSTNFLPSRFEILLETWFTVRAFSAVLGRVPCSGKASHFPVPFWLLLKILLLKQFLWQRLVYFFSTSQLLN